MSTLEPRTMAWAVDAPVRIVGTATSTAAPEALWAVLADHIRWPEWFPNISRVEILGEAEGVGARRRVVLKGGAAVDEEFIAWDEPKLFAFTGTAAKPGIFRALVEHCALEALPDGGTRATWTMCLELPKAVRPFFGLVRPVIAKAVGRGMANLAARAEAAQS